MITLNEIAYNIKNLAYGGKSNGEANLTISQIKHWVHYHRAKLIADNLDKGILSNHIIWQNYELNAGNMLDSVIMQGNLDPAGFTGSDLNRWTNIPKDATPQALDRWTLDSTLTSQNDALTPYLKDSHSLSQYGDYKKLAQFKNDYRNISQAGFTIPEPLMLKDNKSIKSIELDRIAWMTGSVSGFGRAFEPILLPIKTLDEGMYAKHNRFTSNNKPYATLERVDFNNDILNSTALMLKGLQVTPMVDLPIMPSTVPNGTFDTDINDWNQSDIQSTSATWSWDNGALKIESGTIGTVYTDTKLNTINGKQYTISLDINYAGNQWYQIWVTTNNNYGSSPYYYTFALIPEITVNGASNTTQTVTFTAGSDDVYLIIRSAFGAGQNMTIDNVIATDGPTQQNVFWSYKANVRMILADPTKASPSWDDSKTPYPIPMEYVSDLTQRVMSQEMGVVIKTPVDDIEDNMDTTKMMREKGGA